ncbi:MAG: ribosomal protein L11 methyltransferase [Cycloclasticus pugetii]|jgi:ribosomal protein L11 methyltransferase|uniref:Ribosomal protein L11 methyltransferase n=2 Tax=Cycloclasticus TaxID=34067 RepID=S5TV28_9GAMM|nr:MULTISPECIES: 50S ribosomal protein L11 methyltransferase [Cycloclasticus]AGS38940.1 Ribosomal protein L11 methyltransferase [Cycloclasticus zancles 78-ME]ATI02569.1 50S ribosomal protein L11 methyltransferase [Cycloclasticus sp. PY97N]EPD13038.1 ribosomal protein L11 methyltransferase [Cycloclasticus pugetii]MBV1899145.1 50S ribosomal protein L11 methyltransferase [Cycloclasticus sp.]MDF1828966.1 50S ribosomal protein L11 methyltransferase [Cycloclasticus pugetii]|tara:strand:+ start:1501 stop:2382 length:882 start_codon:yes stop_codon:yes gene_type:complete
MAWQQLTIATTQELAATIEGLLENLGALSVTITDRADQPIYEPPLNSTPLWQHVSITGLFDEQDDLKNIEQFFNQQLGHQGEWQLTIERLEDQVWERVWLENFQPIKFGDNFWVCSTEHDIADSNATLLRLDPGLAFGTGTHPTTALCLDWLAKHDLTKSNIIDFGCGSGILAIAGLLLGAKSAIGIDIDPQALIATTSNAEQNNVLDKVKVYAADQYPRKPQAIVIANILAEPLISLSSDISALVKPKGHLLLSGILSEQVTQVISAYQHEFIFCPATIRDNWACLHAVKKT